MRHPFWKTSKILLSYKRLLIPALFGAVVSSACFGAGIMSMLPMFDLLLDRQQPLADLIREKLVTPRTPEFIQHIAIWVADNAPADKFHAFVTVMLFVAALSIIGSTGRYIHELLMLTAVELATMKWRTRLYRRFIHSPMEQVLALGQSDHISRLVGDTRLLSSGYQAILAKGVASILSGACAAAVAIMLNWQLTLIALIGAPIIGVLLRKFGKRIHKATRRAMLQYGRMLGHLSEALRGIRVVKVHSAEGLERRRFQTINRAWFEEEMQKRQAKALSSPLIETLALLGVIGVAVVSAWLIFRRNVPASEFMTVLFALAAAGASLRPLTNLHNTLHEAGAAAERVLEALALPVEATGIHANHKLPPLPRHSREVRFEDVTYSYPKSDRLVLKGVSLIVPHGQRIAIVGGNGSGKTTLLSMLPRLLQPRSGRVLIDGHDIAGVTLRSLRRQIAVVTQESVLFQGTIAQNITYGQRDVPREQIIQAAQAAYADEFISQLPQGYDTMLGEFGEGLSGGQRQRVCLARAVLRDPALFIFDEATSQIDADSEAKINAALRRLCEGRTTFIIAHRLSTVVDADQIVVMGDGHILDIGTHAELLGRCATYQMLTQTQLQALPA